MFDDIDVLHNQLAELFYELQRTRMADAQKLYSELMTLCETNDCFYFADHEKEGNTWYRVFSYRIASYSDFLLPGAIEARGIMFEVVNTSGIPGNEKAIAIKSRPMAKFFNIGENPLTMDLDYSKVKASYIKEDGSLISTFVQTITGMGEDFETSSQPILRLKSKTSTSSSQAVAALEWLKEWPEYYNELLNWSLKGYTVNCEWCAPDNRIVVGYLEPQLIVLNARGNYSGEYADRAELEESFGDWLVKPGQMISGQQDIDRLVNETGYEGVILEFEDGYKVKHTKLKNSWYLHRHRTKDSVNNPAALFDAVLYEASDDLKSLFTEDPLALRIINEMEGVVIPLYNKFVKDVEAFCAENSALERKDFALKAQAQYPVAGSPLNKITFSSIMTLYQGKTPDYKELISKHKRSFIKIADEPVITE